MHVLNHPETQDSLFISWQENQDNQPILDLVGSHDHLQATFASSPPPTSPPLPISSSTPLHAPSSFAESAPPPPPSNQDNLDDSIRDASGHVISADLFQGTEHDVSIIIMTLSLLMLQHQIQLFAGKPTTRQSASSRSKRGQSYSLSSNFTP